jgi:ABC-2 type transport system ATP-binding protein
MQSDSENTRRIMPPHSIGFQTCSRPRPIDLVRQAGCILPTSPGPPKMAQLAVDVQHARKAFAGHVAVKDLSLQVPVGSVYGLLGPNGAGKTTTIRMLLNIIIPDAGSISILGQSHVTPGVLDRVGYLPEERGLYKKMQVRRLLRFLGELKGLGAREADRRIDGWLERLALRTEAKDWGLAKVDELSRGMQQKVQFIGTLLHDPELVILDEPFSGLDPINAQALKDTVLELRQRGRTVIFSTHLMENAERMCDSVCIIARGEKVLDGAVSDVRTTHGGRHIALGLAQVPADAVRAVLSDVGLVGRFDDSSRFFEIELASGATPQSLLRRLVDAGAEIQRFEEVQPSLHQIFLEKVGASGIEDGMSGHG